MNRWLQHQLRHPNHLKRQLLRHTPPLSWRKEEEASTCLEEPRRRMRRPAREPGSSQDTTSTGRALTSISSTGLSWRRVNECMHSFKSSLGTRHTGTRVDIVKT